MAQLIRGHHPQAATHLYDSEPVGVSATSVSYSNDLLVCGTADGAIKVIKPQDGSCIQTFNDHEGPVTGVYSVSIPPP